MPDQSILVIDDEDSSRVGMGQSLRQAGYRVEEAVDGPGGLALVRAHTYAVIVLDLHLGGQNGLEFLRELRLTHNTPVVMVTSDQLLGPRLEGLENGADDWLIKPFAHRELLARVAAILRRVPFVSGVVRLGDLQIDLDSQVITRQGTTIVLTPRELDLLQLLLENRGRVVLRDLLEKKMSQAKAGSPVSSNVSNLVDVYMLRLRKKLGKEIISTRHGIGFIIEA